MKKWLFIAAFIFSSIFCSSMYANQQIDITLQIIKVGGAGKPLPKAPTHPLMITQEDNVLTLPANSCGYTLLLLGENGEIEYSAFIVSGITQVFLPLSLSGDFEILLYPEDSDYYFYGLISL